VCIDSFPAQALHRMENSTMRIVIQDHGIATPALL
jgi:hypothetical protein